MVRRRFYMGERRSVVGGGGGTPVHRHVRRRITRRGRGTRKYTAAPGPRPQGVTLAGGVVLRALVALLRDRKTDGMRVSVQIVGRGRAMRSSRKRLSRSAPSATTA